MFEKLELARFKEHQKKKKKGGRGSKKKKKKRQYHKIPRAKKKYVTGMCLATLETDNKEAQRYFAQKFSCVASVTRWKHSGRLYRY